MKNKLLFKLIFLIFLFLNNNLYSDTLNIKSKTISANKNKKIIVFKGEVIAKDSKNNLIETETAEYIKDEDILIVKDNVKIITSEGYEVLTDSLKFDNKRGLIVSNNPSQIKDIDGNLINVEMFEYDRNKNLFFSKGLIKILDILENTYEFSEIYIDERKKKIVGSDLRAFFNSDQIKTNPENNPRIFGNTISISGNDSEIGKGIFTYCKMSENKRCPAWSIQAEKLNHDTEKKTIYYKNAILKIYDVPVFYFPKFFHPDPTVKRQSGFLTPSFIDSRNLGTGLVLPYFLNLADDRDFTFTPKVYSKENPLFVYPYP